MVRDGLILGRATAGQDLPQELLLDNAATPSKAECKPLLKQPLAISGPSLSRAGLRFRSINHLLN